ncbi:NmrA family NAD(P)-binding protein [Nonomuraea sp. NEAU-A123]|uniref:NmrA family NAD(P)-binding protein n=1 Tax=Nonomuraea sp. NEAU-A123 TaxID=2839649 RepID=UPI001BE44154|nr:NmrA family NAD(P)-binding protein [Nonomuraea sp. NEAU-A123]MBT2224888.1 NmrA family NAD(P)-binding protein [Nonomuraea sp. NEAU-A123]
MNTPMDTHGKTILVTGATGNQGGATARHLLADGWRVRALVRDDTAPAAAALAAAGAELVRGDLDDRASIDAAIRGAYGVYSVQSANDNEIAQGKNVADAAKAADVQHVVYSSVGGVESQNRFYVEHGWGPIDKWQIEEHLRGLGVPATILRPAGFMQDFTSPARFFQNGSLNVPWHDDLVMQLVAIDDIGAFAALAFAEPAAYLGEAMEITGDRLTAPQIADALSTAAGRRIPRTRIPLETLWEHNPEVAKVFTWANETYYDTDLAPLRKAHAALMDFSTWLDRSGKARLLAQLDSLPA